MCSVFNLYPSQRELGWLETQAWIQEQVLCMLVYRGPLLGHEVEIREIPMTEDPQSNDPAETETSEATETEAEAAPDETETEAEAEVPATAETSEPA